MRTYTFEPQHRDLILEGGKDFTIRQPGRQHHARLAERMGLKFKGSPAAWTAPVTLRAKIVIAPQGLLRVIGLQQLPAANSLAMLLTAAEQGAYKAADNLPHLAQRDGFASWADLYAWHAPGQEAQERLTRELIAWDARALAPAA